MDSFDSIFRLEICLFGVHMHWIYAHLMGDFIFQNDWMAAGKKKSRFICTVHVAVYISLFLFCCFEVWQLLAIAIAHWLQDWFGIEKIMKVMGQQNFLENNAPWSRIVVDGILHVLWIAFVNSFSS